MLSGQFGMSSIQKNQSIFAYENGEKIAALDKTCTTFHPFNGRKKKKTVQLLCNAPNLFSIVFLANRGFVEHTMQARKNIY